MKKFWGEKEILKLSCLPISVISSYIVAVFLVAYWIYFLRIGRMFTRLHGSVHEFAVWKVNILPLLTAICLLLTGNIIFLAVGILFWFISWWMPLLGFSAPFTLSIVYGYIIGVAFGVFFNITFPYSRFVLGIVGIVIIQIVCSLILNFITSSYEPQNYVGKQAERLIENSKRSPEEIAQEKKDALVGYAAILVLIFVIVLVNCLDHDFYAYRLTTIHYYHVNHLIP